ncbi:hypothetical protein [Kitasatospora sp. NPDC002040]|uniref:hypothetical protein n=1 Tax=Kitasatospora sp. NPDC002040 TaxID=3154661 RepID=UPI0033182629
MTSTTITKRTSTVPTDGEARSVEARPTVAELRLPDWYFAFEAVLAGAYDLISAFPSSWPALVALGVVNLTVSLTVLRTRLKLAKLMWRGKGTRRLAFALLGVRIGLHVVLGLLGLAIGGTLGHLALGLLMSALTIALLVHAQRTSLRALVADGRVLA